MTSEIAHTCTMPPQLPEEDQVHLQVLRQFLARPQDFSSKLFTFICPLLIQLKAYSSSHLQDLGVSEALVYVVGRLGIAMGWLSPSLQSFFLLSSNWKRW